MRAIQGGRDRRPLEAIAPAASGSTAVAAPADVAPPADMTTGGLAVWMREAPLAIAERTLTPATAAHFCDLCELEAQKNLMLKQIGEQVMGIAVTEAGAFQKPNPLLTHYRMAVQRLSSLRKDFKLAPLGKEIFVPAEPKANPLDKFTNRRRG